MESEDSRCGEETEHVVAAGQLSSPRRAGVCLAGIAFRVTRRVVAGAFTTIKTDRQTPDRYMTRQPRRWRHRLQLRQPAAAPSLWLYTYDDRPRPSRVVIGAIRSARYLYDDVGHRCPAAARMLVGVFGTRRPTDTFLTLDLRGGCPSRYETIDGGC